MKTLNQVSKEYGIGRWDLKKLIKENYLLEDYDYVLIRQISKDITKFTSDGEKKVIEYIKERQ